MEYIINSISQEGEIVTTNTTITLDTGTVITVDIAHFLPNSFDDINQGIINRALSEQKKIDALNNISILIENIPTNQTIIVNN